MQLQDLRVDIQRGIVLTPRGERFPIKEHHGWKFINFQGKKISVSKLPSFNSDNEDHDHVYNYIFERGFINYPCPAMSYWIIRHRLKQIIGYRQFKIKYQHCFIHFKPMQ